MTEEEWIIIKAMIYGSKRIPVSAIQYKYKIGYNAVFRLLEPLVKAGLISLSDEGIDFNWQHPDWHEIAKQRHLWQPWALRAAEPMLFCDDIVEDDKYWMKEQYHGRFAEYVAVFEDHMQAIEWSMEYAEMRDLLLQKTRELLQGKGEFLPTQDVIAFKNIQNAQFATMTIADYLAEKCRLTDRKTRQVYEFDDIEDLLIAGWRLD